MAVILAVVVLVPVEHLLRRTPALAVAAVQPHAGHEFEPGVGLPSCCVPLPARVGDPLGDPSPSATVPDLEPDDLRFVGGTRFSFQERLVSMLTYTDANGGVFSLYITDGDAREFKLLATRSQDGTSQARLRVAGERDRADEHEVVIWEHGGLVHTWIGPPARPSTPPAHVCSAATDSSFGTA